MTTISLIFKINKLKTIMNNPEQFTKFIVKLGEKKISDLLPMDDILMISGLEWLYVHRNDTISYLLSSGDITPMDLLEKFVTMLGPENEQVVSKFVDNLL